MTDRSWPLPLADVSITDSFWAQRIDRVRTRTLPLQHEQLQRTGRLDALRLGWKPGDDPVPHIFWDSDVAKWIEAACYSLATVPDPALEHDVDAAIELLANAQQDDGYLNTYFTVVEPGRRWTDLRDAHELYCAGHLIEAGVAHFEVTGKRTLLDVVARYADHIHDVFGDGPGQKRGYPGHEEIELALVRLYRVTGETRYLRLASFFVEERGREPYYFEQEALQRGTPGHFGGRPPFDRRGDDPEYFREYNQSHAPIRDQQQVVGHAVRAMYLFSAVADLASETGDDSLAAACRRLWANLTARRMYVTGGLGSTRRIEGFTTDYDLPNQSAYAETCASIGLVFWAHRMAALEHDGRYVDVLERALYNGVLAGISADGSTYFYENPLASRGDHHRQEWFGVACCPPNLARLLTSLGAYVYGRRGDELLINLFMGSNATVDVAGTRVTIEQRTSYPWDGEVELVVRPERPVELTVSVRVPGWCEGPILTLGDQPVDLAEASDRGYASVRRTWDGTERLRLVLPMPVRRCYAHPRVAADAGRVAVMRGPLVYCAEEVDHGVDVERLALPRDSVLEPDRGDDLPGTVLLRGRGRRLDDEDWGDEDWGDEDWGEQLYRPNPPVDDGAGLTLVPYFAWENRAPGTMLVWMRED